MPEMQHNMGLSVFSYWTTKQAMIGLIDTVSVMLYKFTDTIP